MKRIEAIIYGMLGAVLIAVLAPLIIQASQTYVLTDNSIGQRTAFNTHLPNAFEAVRSSFSGSSAPTSPTPVDGQSWHDTSVNRTKDRVSGSWRTRALLELSNIFTASPQTISSSDDARWVATDTTNTITSRLQATDTEGRVGTSTNHAFCIETNGNCRATWSGAGSMTGGIVPLARMMTQEGTEPNFTSWTSAGVTVFNSGTLNVVAGDRIYLYFNVQVFPEASTTAIYAIFKQTSGTAGGVMMDGNAATGDFIAWMEDVRTDDGLRSASGVTVVRVTSTGNGQMVLTAIGQTNGATVAAGFHVLVQVMRGT